MKIICVTMAALVVAATAAPATAQYGQGDYRQDPLGRGFGDLRMQIDEGLRSGRIARDEAFSLDEELRMLARLEDHYRRDGLSGWERGDLQRRIVLLRDRIRFVESRGARGEPPGYGDRDYDEPGYERSWEDSGAPPPVDRPLPRSGDYGSVGSSDSGLPDEDDWQDADIPPEDQRWQDESTSEEPLADPDATARDKLPAEDGATGEDEEWDDSDWEYEPI